MAFFRQNNSKEIGCEEGIGIGEAQRACPRQNALKRSCGGAVSRDAKKERICVMGKAIVVTSGKGGVGKTTATVNIGAALAEQGKNVLLIDADLGLRNLDLMMGVENRIVYDVVDVLEGRCRLRQAVVRNKRNDRLALLPASQTRNKDALKEGQLKNLIQEVRDSYDFILIDCPAGIEQGFSNAVEGAEEAVLVCTPEIASVRDADRVAGLLAASEVDGVRLVVNRVRADLVRKREMMSVEDIEEILGLKAVGAVPEDPLVVRAANLGEPLIYSVRSAAGQEYRKIAQKLAGLREIPDRKHGMGAWVQKLLGVKAAG